MEKNNYIYLHEVIARAKAKGMNVNNSIIASAIWSDSNEKTQQVNMSRLVNGRSKAISINAVHIICKLCRCTPNELFGYRRR